MANNENVMGEFLSWVCLGGVKKMDEEFGRNLVVDREGNE